MHTWSEFSLKYTGDRQRQLGYEIKLMLSRVSWAVAQISFYEPLCDITRDVVKWKIIFSHRYFLPDCNWKHRNCFRPDVRKPVGCWHARAVMAHILYRVKNRIKLGACMVRSIAGILKRTDYEDVCKLYCDVPWVAVMFRVVWKNSLKLDVVLILY